MSAPLAFDPRTAGWSWAEWGLDPLDPETIAEIDAIPLGANLEDYDPDKDPVRSGAIRAFTAPSPMLRVPDQLNRFGVPFGVVDGWGSRGYLPMTGRGGFINHWIVSPIRLPARRASLALIINGHSALAGPLANLYMDLDGYVMIVAALSANHGGIGSWNGVSENPNWVGIECEGGPTLTDAQLAMLPRVNAAVAAALGKDASRWCIAHSEYAPKRKVDIGGYMPPIRSKAAALIAGGGLREDDDMTPEQDKMLREVHGVLFSGPPNAGGTPRALTIAGKIDTLTDLAQEQRGVTWAGTPGTPVTHTLGGKLNAIAKKLGVDFSKGE